MPRLSRLAGALAFSALGCMYREAHVTQSVAMSPMTDATMNVALDRMLVSTSILLGGFGEDSSLTVVLRVTNAGREPYTLNAASISCWLELSPDRPDQTRALTAVAGGGGDPWAEHSKVGSIPIPPGETRQAWVRFKNHRYPGSDVPRKVTIWFPDARGRRVELVIADPGRGQRWEVEPLPLGFGLGLQMTTLSSAQLEARAMSAQLFWVFRLGPLLGDAGMSNDLILLRSGPSESSGFSGINWNAHLTVPLFRWSFLPRSPWLIGIYGGGAAGYFNPLARTDSQVGGTHGVLSAEGGVEVDFTGPQPVQTPFPISYSRPALPSWMVRAGYTHWWVSGNAVNANGGGSVFAIRFTW